MRFNLVKTIIAIALSLLIAYGFFVFWGGEQESNLHYTTAITALLFSMVTLVGAFGCKYETERITAILRMLSGLSFFVGLGALILITLFTNSLPVLIIVMGILSLIYILIVYAIAQSGQ